MTHIQISGYRGPDRKSFGGSYRTHKYTEGRIIVRLREAKATKTPRRPDYFSFLRADVLFAIPRLILSMQVFFCSELVGGIDRIIKLHVERF